MSTTAPNLLAEITILFTAGLFSGGINSIAGGGSFVSFPALLLCNVPVVSANATNSLAVWPGLVGASWGYRNRLRPHWRALLLVSILSILGGTCGGLLVLITPPLVFERLVPWLLLLGTLLLAFSFFRARRSSLAPCHEVPLRSALPTRLGDLRSFIQFAISVYGGYFVGGVGILQMATLSLFGVQDVRNIVGLKNLFGILMGTASLVTLIIGGKIVWPAAIALTIGSVVGGLGGIRLSQHLSPALVRTVILIFCIAMTAWFFHKFS